MGQGNKATDDAKGHGIDLSETEPLGKDEPQDGTETERLLGSKPPTPCLPRAPQDRKTVSEAPYVSLSEVRHVATGPPRPLHAPLFIVGSCTSLRPRKRSPRRRTRSRQIISAGARAWALRGFPSSRRAAAWGMLETGTVERFEDRHHFPGLYDDPEHA
ncbi:hypothetical protein ACLOJK_013669 [Asimina triloba]